MLKTFQAEYYVLAEIFVNDVWQKMNTRFVQMNAMPQGSPMGHGLMVTLTSDPVTSKWVCQVKLIKVYVPVEFGSCRWKDFYVNFWSRLKFYNW